MKENIKIAWRNLWRNKRRTAITISSIFFAVFFAILMRSFQLGSYGHMLDNIVSQFTGHLQIQDKEYFDEPSIDNAIAVDPRLLKSLDSMPEIKFYTERLETGGLVSNKNISRLGFVYGVDMNKEDELSKFKRKLVRYIVDSNVVINVAQKLSKHQATILMKYKQRAYANINDLALDLAADRIDTNVVLKELKDKIIQLQPQEIKPGANELYIGYRFAQFLEANVGDSIVIFGQGYHGSTAVGKFKIAGLLQFPNDAFNTRIIYMPLKTAQLFSGAYQIDNNNDTTFYVSYISINTIYSAGFSDDDYNKCLVVANKIQSQTNDKYLTVVGWHNLNQDLYNLLTFDNKAGKIMIYVLYLIISFGVLGTVMMLIAERKREFGVMMAIGMKRGKLSLIVAIEMFFMGMISFILGLIVTSPIIYYGFYHPFVLHGEAAKGMADYNIEPVMGFAWYGSYITEQIVIVVIIVVAVLIYALLKIRRLKVIEALRA